VSRLGGEPARQRVRDAGPRAYAWGGLVALGLLIGAYGALLTLVEGTTVLGLSDQVPWGILISTYVFFALSSTGICIGVTSLSSVFGITAFAPLMKRGVLLSLFTLAAGGSVIMSGLGQPFRAVPQMLLSPNPSAPMWWMIGLYSVYGSALVAEFYLLDRAEQPSRRLTVGVGLVALVAPILAGGMLGGIFGTAEARPYYGGIFASVYLLVTAVFSGVALLTAVTIVERRLTDATAAAVDETLLTDTLATYLGALAGATLLLTALRHVSGLVATDEALALAHEHMLLGTHGAWALGVGVGIGMVVPFALLALPRTRTVGGVFTASVLALIGLFASRLEFVLGGQVVALTDDPSHQFPLVSYAPSVAEVAIVVFGFALFAFLYTTARLLFDLDERPDHGATEMTRSNSTATPEVTDDD